MATNKKDIKFKQSLTNVQNIGWSISEPMFNQMSEYEKRYFLFEFGAPWSPDSYIQRLKKIGFSGLGSILDVGCGMGQWSHSLATINKSLTGIDINNERLEIARHICKGANLKNVDFFSAKAEELPFKSENFEAIFCYSMIMFVPIKQVLLEFNRVLKDGGKLYINVDSNGYYLDLFVKSMFKTRNFGMGLTCIKFVIRGFLRKDVRAAISPRRLKKILEKAGFKVLEIAPEGMIGSGGDEKLQLKYQTNFISLPYVTEAVVIKSLDKSSVIQEMV